MTKRVEDKNKVERKHSSLHLMATDRAAALFPSNEKEIEKKEKSKADKRDGDVHAYHFMKILGKREQPDYEDKVKQLKN